MKKFLTVVGKILGQIRKAYLGFVDFTVKICFLFWTALVLYLITNPGTISYVFRVGDEVSVPLVSRAADLFQSSVKLEMRAKDGKLLAEPICSSREDDNYLGNQIVVGESGEIYSFLADPEAWIIDEPVTEVEKIYIRRFRVPNSANEAWFAKPRPYMQKGESGMEYAHSGAEPKTVGMMMAVPQTRPKPCNTLGEVWKRIERLRSQSK